MVYGILDLGEVQMSPQNRLEDFRSGTTEALWVGEAGPSVIGGNLQKALLVAAGELFNRAFLIHHSGPLSLRRFA